MNVGLKCSRMNKHLNYHIHQPIRRCLSDKVNQIKDFMIKGLNKWELIISKNYKSILIVNIKTNNKLTIINLKNR